MRSRVPGLLLLAWYGSLLLLRAVWSLPSLIADAVACCLRRRNPVDGRDTPGHDEGGA